MSDIMYRCSFCGWCAVLAPSDVAQDARCWECTTGRLVVDHHPSESDWNEAHR